MSISVEQHKLALREQWLEKAKCELSFLDAVYLIHYYNFEIRTVGPRPWPTEISPQEAFLQFDESEYNNCLEKAKALLHKTSYVGASHWNYKDALPYEEAIIRMKREHPGFNDTSYTLTARKSASDMKW
jgi:hypothetical protein